MRITNDEYTPLHVLSELLSYQRLRAADTAKFAEEDWRNHDWLLQSLQERIDVILESFRRLGCEVHETQHLRDHGVDIRLRVDFDAVQKVIGFQIKANNEAAKDAKRAKGAESLAATLKRQAYEAMSLARVDEWWVLLCFDKKDHARRISMICSELQGPEDRFKVVIVQPEKALSLLNMTEEDVDAVCTLLLCRDDEVLRDARAEAGSLSKAALNVVLETLDDALHGDVYMQSSELHSYLSDEEGKTGLDAVDELEQAEYLSWSRDRDCYQIEVGRFAGVCALYFEGRVRHKLSRTSASRFVSRLLTA